MAVSRSVNPRPLHASIRACSWSALRTGGGSSGTFGWGYPSEGVAVDLFFGVQPAEQRVGVGSACRGSTARLVVEVGEVDLECAPVDLVDAGRMLLDLEPHVESLGRVAIQVARAFGAPSRPQCVVEAVQQVGKLEGDSHAIRIVAWCDSAVLRSFSDK